MLNARRGWEGAADHAGGTVPPAIRSSARPRESGRSWSYGHRNPQEPRQFDARGQLWEVEHGTRGGDELNLIQRGKNYGWAR